MVNERSRCEGDDVDPEIRFEPADDGATKVVLAIDGSDVSRAYIIPFTIRIGVATMRMDGIGGVATSEAFRNRGLSRRVIEAAVRWMQAGDAELTTLFGIADYYPKFGYATIGPHYVIRLTSVSRIAQHLDDWRVRALRPEDLQTVKQLYDDNTADAVGAVVRTSKSRSWSKFAEAVERADECRVVVDRGDRVAAYLWRASHIWWSEERLRKTPQALAIGEAVAANAAAADAALGAARLWAEESGKAEIDLAATPESPMAAAAMFNDAQIETYYERAGDWMGRVLGPHRFLKALCPELSVRWRAANADFGGALRIETDEGSATLILGADSVQMGDETVETGDVEMLRVTMPQHALARLAFGAFPPGDVLARTPSPPDERSSDVLAALFPRRQPWLYPADWF